ncbi:hypothetical protein [Oceanicola sp. 502str15]|uniref:hypothetical protein n=1 Tax=Oceanicola sp. 502str15 TaxID=2696061 RepID=UPI0020949FFC|nr:hypothetical protein [Oceanicola sp. 502str15]MCO6384962.1 hypothetical protein [Oceanicola sp. 502str15]
MALADSSLAHAGAGAALMGGWAFYANSGHPMPAPLLAALVQGAMTAAITYGLKRVQEALVPRLPGVAGLVMPPLVCCAISFGLLFAIHSLAGTPEVLATLAVPTTVATLYACLYTWRLWSRG